MTYEPSRRQPSFTPRTPQSQAPYGQAQPHDGKPNTGTRPPHRSSG